MSLPIVIIISSQITLGLTIKLLAVEKLSDEEDDISELVGEGGNEFVPPLLPILPRLEY